MVIRFTLDDSTCTIEGLGEDEAHHLVGESHLGEGNLLVGTAIDGIGEAVGTTDDEDESASSRLFALQPLGIFDASELLSVLIQQDDGVGWLDEFEDEFSLTLLLLLFAEALGVLELRDSGDGDIYSVYLKLVSHGDAYANVVLSHVEHCHATKQVTEEFI